MQPKQNDWKFVEELTQPASRIFSWSRSVAKKTEVDLSTGVNLILDFPDPAKLLQTAYQDLKDFFNECNIAMTGDYEIVTELEKTLTDDAFKITISESSCRISAGNREGIRRGIYHLEDLLLGTDGPFLPLGEIHQAPWIKNRISRCFFGPIKRPPLNRDELMDDVDYYPDEYLNRLAHEGVNALWLTIAFSDLCKTSITKLAPNAEKRLAKLRRTVEKCLRYGIKIYIFCIEPRAMAFDDPLLQNNPILKGAESYDGSYCFCPFSEVAQKYLYDSMSWIFTQVPSLGGMINISFGERATTCLSSDFGASCPVCSQKTPGEIIAASLKPMERGMHEVAPDAELISWLYVPLNGTGSFCAEQMMDVANKLPENVILQYNFESSGGKEQLGKYRHAGDYWLSYVGPSKIFTELNEIAHANQNAVSAKIQVGCSHEVATIPFVPVPALLYRKYREMHKLGVSSVMQCWYFGNYPGIMNKAAGLLAFEDFNTDEQSFLKRLALPDWGEHADAVVAAWTLFAEGYSHYPLSNMFQYYGPMHDGVVWPLYLFPAHKPLAPTWKLEFGISGDAIGECLRDHTIDEAIILCRTMSEKWNQGVDILKKLRSNFKDNPARLKDIGLAEALAIQFESGYNILEFYSLREQLFNSECSMQKEILYKMKAIVLDEISRSKRLTELCENDSRLGFHSEAEGYKYFPEKLEWRIEMLKNLLSEDFPTALSAITKGQLTSGLQNDAPKYVCDSNIVEECDLFRWKARSENNALVFDIECKKNGSPDHLFLAINTDNNSFPLLITVSRSGKVVPGKSNCTAKVTKHADSWSTEITIPETIIACNTKEFVRMSIIRLASFAEKEEYCAWPKNNRPSLHRLVLGAYNPQNTGLLILNKITEKTKTVKMDSVQEIMEKV